MQKIEKKYPLPLTFVFSRYTLRQGCRSLMNTPNGGDGGSGEVFLPVL